MSKDRRSVESMQINLEEFLMQLMKQWKIFGIIVVLCAILFAGVAALFGKEISVPHSEEYLFYEDALARHQVYVVESVLMTLDPTSIHERTIFIRNITDKELLESYVMSSEIWEDLETDRNKKYISELLTWNEDTSTGNIELVLRHETTEECEVWAEYIKEKIYEYNSSVEVIIGPERIVADEYVQQEQLRRYTRTEHIKSLLLDSRAGYTISISIPIASMIGGSVGFLITMISIFVLYLFDFRGFRGK